jgi:hypothetical protein
MLHVYRGWCGINNSFRRQGVSGTLFYLTGNFNFDSVRSGPKPKLWYKKPPEDVARYYDGECCPQYCHAKSVTNLAIVDSAAVSRWEPSGSEKDADQEEIDLDGVEDEEEDELMSHDSVGRLGSEDGRHWALRGSFQGKHVLQFCLWSGHSQSLLAWM